MQLIGQHCIVARAEDLESDYQGLEPHSTFYQLWFWGMLCNRSELLFILFIILIIFIYGIKPIFSVEGNLWVGVEDFFLPI